LILVKHPDGLALLALAQHSPTPEHQPLPLDGVIVAATLRDDSGAFLKAQKFGADRPPMQVGSVLEFDARINNARGKD